MSENEKNVDWDLTLRQSSRLFDQGMNAKENRRYPEACELLIGSAEKLVVLWLFMRVRNNDDPLLEVKELPLSESDMKKADRICNLAVIHCGFAMDCLNEKDRVDVEKRIANSDVTAVFEELKKYEPSGLETWGCGIAMLFAAVLAIYFGFTHSYWWLLVLTLPFLWIFLEILRLKIKDDKSWTP